MMSSSFILILAFCNSFPLSDELLATLKKGCSSNMKALGLISGLSLRHTSKNDWHSLDTPSGNLGGSFVSFIMFKICLVYDPRSLQGGLPVSISMAKHPKLQMSTANE